MPRSSEFAGEDFLLEHPPDFQAEWKWITAKLVATVAFSVVVVPILLPVFFGSEEQSLDCEANNAPKDDSEARRGVGKHRDKRGKPQQAESQTIGAGASKHQHRDKHRKPRTEKAENEALVNDVDQTGGGGGGTNIVVTVPPLLVLGINLSCVLIGFIIIFNSPNNRDVARSVFQAPLLSGEECDRIIAMSKRAAERNLGEALKEKAKEDANAALSNRPREQIENRKGKTLLDEPVGWNKDRHDLYPTIDLNVVTDPFTEEDRKFIESRLDARLSPVIGRVYGIAPAAIRATDIFVVRYDFEKGQTALRGHTDSSHVSFNVLLNEDFTGGGTRFHNRRTKTHADAKPKRGQVLVNNAMVYHEGLPVTWGTRYILVGFLSVDRIDPSDQEPTGLSLFASWLSLPWAQVKFTEGLYASAERLEDGGGGGETKWTDNKYVRSLLADLRVALTFIGDVWSPHKLTTLVKTEDATKFIAALDRSHDERKKRGDLLRLATWFKNQQLVMDIDGKITSEWRDRQLAQEKFKDL